ncbi:hypothetical protein HY612_01260 [Candidatus Roizmanbacteria bacterium]|nr:hypothetical protein [Candidatus Roizmanbacteria bacterium]
MVKLKIILISLAVLVFTTLAFAYFAPQSKNTPVSHVAIRLVLDQTPDYRLSVKTLGVENAYFSDYKLDIPFGYYNIKILGNKNVAFFSGKVAKNKVSFPPYEIVPQDEGPSSSVTIIEPLGQIGLFLPYFPQAKKIIFLDEKKQEKLQVDIAKLGLPKDFSKKLCGNGICDFNENFLRCYKDCKFNVYKKNF